ncbi:MAG: hypothetical protein KFH87_07675, partial [Bacteroidetes bacterium]|nr:hypothetical protein [Bacteroidota bacterium]
TVIEDMGDHSTREVHNMYEAYSIIPNIPDPTLNRKIKKLSKEEWISLATEAQCTKSDKGRELQKKRVEFVEHIFAHTLRKGGFDERHCGIKSISVSDIRSLAYVSIFRCTFVVD